MPCNTAIVRRLLVVAAVVAALSATLCGCNKDDSGLLEVFAESFGSDTKLVVNNRIASWQDGDKIRINDTTAAIRRQLSQGDTHAYIPSTAASAVNRAVFPSSLCSSITGDNITITLPSEYRYRTAGGLQVLEVPMAAASAEESPLHFRHLTGALNIRIQGRNEPVILESVTISSDKYQLSGCWPLNFADIAGDTAREATSDEQKSVSLKFDGTELPANDSLDVIIPVPSVGSDNHFTVTVKARHEGRRYVYTRSQTGDADHSLGRNVMGYAKANMAEEEYIVRKPVLTLISTGMNLFGITSKEDFLFFIEAINNDWDAINSVKYKEFNFRLTNTIDLEGVTINPIVNFASGTTFDGDSNAIKNFTITIINTQSSTYQCGLFASPKATIKNLILDNVKLQHSGNATTLQLSPLCTKTSNCTILNCTIGDVEVDAHGTISELYYGGLSALVTTNLNVSSCTINGNVILPHVSGDLFFGGLISQISAPGNIGSQNDFNVIISNCTIDNHQLGLNSNGRVYFGGMIGAQSTADVSFSNCKWNGIVTIDAQNTYAGGLSASYSSYPGTNLSLSNSNLSGSITASVTGHSSYLGRFIGKKSGSGHYTNDTSTSTIVLTLNGDTINKDIGNQ